MQLSHLLQDKICHPESLVLRSPRNIYCNVCQKECIVDLYNFVLQPFEDHFYSSAVAQAFHAWTGDDQIPMTFTVVDVEGILSKRVTGQTLAKVRECVQLLKMLNAPFTTEPHDFSDRELMNNFTSRYMESVVGYHRSTEMSTEQRLLNHIIAGMQQMVQSDEYPNSFEFYFQTLVPYVQNCVVQWTPLSALPSEENLAKELLVQLQRSNKIRQIFGIYSIPFDAIHALVASYGCSNDLEMVGNWVLDFMARLCRGCYFWKRYPECLFVKAMLQCLQTEVTRRNHMALYRVMQQLRQGNAVESLSALWNPYMQLVALVHRKFQVRGMSSEVLRIACHQMFPAVLFEENADQLGFTMALMHLLLTVDRKTGIVQKGGFKKARHIYETVQKFIKEVCQFENNQPTLWTMDTLQMFLVCQPNLEKEMVMVAKLIFTEESDFEI